MLARSSLPKICPCVGGRCLTASLSGVREVSAGTREYSTATPKSIHLSTREYSTANSTQSIFSPHASPWDQVFEEIKNVDPPPAPAASLNPTMTMHARLGKGVRSQAATARESQAINEMFSYVFEKTLPQGAAPATLSLGRPRKDADKNHTYRKFRLQSQRLRWSTEVDQEVDRKKEQMELCETDVQLLEWAMREVFEESQRFEQAVRPPVDDAAAQETSDSSAPSEGMQLQPSWYPHVLAALIRTFRDKYKDPHLALSMFDHARHLSVASFVFGCTTPAYNELIETRWKCFRDLRGVVDALEEMRVNGVQLNSRTRLLGEAVRREVGERELWQEESTIGSGEVWELVARLERLTVASKPRRTRNNELSEKGGDRTRGRKWSAAQETWKTKVLEEGGKKDHSEKWTPKNVRPAFELSSSMAVAESLRKALQKIVT